MKMHCQMNAPTYKACFKLQDGKIQYTITVASQFSDS